MEIRFRVSEKTILIAEFRNAGRTLSRQRTASVYPVLALGASINAEVAAEYGPGLAGVTGIVEGGEDQRAATLAASVASTNAEESGATITNRGHASLPPCCAPRKSWDKLNWADLPPVPSAAR